MTDEKIISLKGQELNDAVAVALGFILKKADPWDPKNVDERRTKRWESPKGQCYKPVPNPRESGIWYPTLPDYQGSIDAAWPLFLELVKKYDRVELHGVGDGFVAMIEQGDEVAARYIAQVEAETGEEAICKLYLLEKNL